MKLSDRIKKEYEKIKKEVTNDALGEKFIMRQILPEVEKLERELFDSNEYIGLLEKENLELEHEIEILKDVDDINDYDGVY